MLRLAARLSSRCAAWTARTTNQDPVISSRVLMRTGVAVQGLLVEVEHLHVVRPGEGVGSEENGEEQHLGQDEGPDDKIAGEALAAGASAGRAVVMAVMAG